MSVCTCIVIWVCESPANDFKVSSHKSHQLNVLPLALISCQMPMSNSHQKHSANAWRHPVIYYSNLITHLEYFKLSSIQLRFKQLIMIIYNKYYTISCIPVEIEYLFIQIHVLVLYEYEYFSHTSCPTASCLTC